MNKNNLVLTFCLLFSVLNTQGQTYSLAKKMSISSQLFTTDKLQQIYLINAENEIIKLTCDSVQIGKYSNKKLGKIESIDATNPFNVLVYYKDFQTLVMLNRSMVETGVYSLADLNVVQAGPVAVGEDNSIWLYDLGTSKLQKFVTEGNAIRATSTNIIQFKGAKPNKILVQEGSVYMNAPDNGIFVFDLFGKLSRKFELKGLTDFQIVDKHIIYRQAGEFFRYHLLSFATVAMKLPDGVAIDANIRVERGKLFVRANKELKVFDAK
jgi:hypothetical protein